MQGNVSALATSESGLLSQERARGILTTQVTTQIFTKNPGRSNTQDSLALTTTTTMTSQISITWPSLPLGSKMQLTWFR